jgi:hypothetical protein
MLQETEPQRVPVTEHLKLLAVLTNAHGLRVNDLVAAFAHLERLVCSWAPNFACLAVDLCLVPNLVGFGRSHEKGSKSKKRFFIVYHLRGAYSLIIFLFYLFDKNI